MFKYLRELCFLSYVLYGCELVYTFLDVEELKGVKYGIEITKKPVLFSLEPLDNVLHLSSKYGQMYQCVMPTKKSEEQIESEKNKTLESNSTVSSILNDTLHGQCLYYTKGWWTYKLCYKKEITQFHEAENGIVQGDIISLGVFDFEKDWNNTDTKKSKSTSNTHHTQNYANGTICELIGKPRHTVVKFYCDEETTSSIISIDEPETCSYTIVVNTKDLCTHPLFKPPKKAKPEEITCSPALTQEQYSEFVKKEKELQRQKEEARKRQEEEKGSTKKNKAVKGFPELMQGLLNVGQIFDAFVSDEKTKKKDKNTASNDEKDNDFSPEDVGSEMSQDKEKSEKSSDIIAEPEEPDDNGAKQEGSPPIADASVTKDEPEPINLGNDQLFSENEAGQGENKLSSEGEFIDTKDAMNKLGESASSNPAVKKLLSFQKRLRELDEKTEALKKQDHTMRKILKKQFLRTRRKALAQIKGFKDLMKKLVAKKAETKNEKSRKAVDVLIEKVSKNIKTYKERIATLDLKMKSALDYSNKVDERYEKLLGESATRKTSDRITNILKDIFKSTDKTGKDRIAVSGDKLPTEEPENKPAFEEALKEEENIYQNPDKNVEKNNDKVLDAVFKFIQKANKKVGTKAEKGSNEEASKDITSNEESKTIKELENNDDVAEGSGAGKVKVKFSKLGSEDVKILEEQERQEELAGTGTDAGRVRAAGKKIEKMIKDKLKKAGVDVGTNIKIKIITNDAQMSKLKSDSEATFLTQDTATQFKDMLVNLLGGGEEKVKEERRHSQLEDNYKFVYSQENNNEQKERTDEDHNQYTLL